MKGAIYAAGFAALSAVASAGWNDAVTKKSVPDVIDGASIHFTAVSHSTATIEWKAPGKGDWQWPILGYKIQMTSSGSNSWTEAGEYTMVATDTGWTSVAGITTPGITTADSYASDLTWGVCPDNTAGICADGELTAEYGTDTAHALPGLTADTIYYFRIAAYNHDGEAAWSTQSYALVTHAVPAAVAAPVVKSVTKDSITIEWKTPITTGTDACTTPTYVDGLYTATDAVGSSAVSRDLAGETCFGFNCMRTSVETCQAIGQGSPVVSYKIASKLTSADNFAEITDIETGLALYPMEVAGSVLTCDNDECSYTIGGLLASTSYDFQVQATNAVAEGVASSPVSATTLGIPTLPKPPTATAVTETTITLTWNTLKGYCSEENEPSPSPVFTNLYKQYPSTPTRSAACRLDSGDAITGVRIFGSSYNPTASDPAGFEGSVHADGEMYTHEYQQTSDGTLGSAASGDWEPARRGSLTDDTGSKTYASAPLSKSLPVTLDNGVWLEFNLGDAAAQAALLADPEFVVTHLAQDTYYKFVIVFTNGVGDSLPSLESEFFLTLEAVVSDLKMHSQPPCIYETSTATRFVATSTGTNVFYKWQLPDGRQVNSHDERQYGSVIAEGNSDNCKTADCSVMEFVLPSISTQTGPSAENTFTIAVVGYNTRGQTVLQTEYDIKYCGCTDPWDPDYWDQATYHMPLMCEYESWDGADKEVISGEFQFYQLYYKEATHTAQVIVRVDEGKVDLFTSTTQIPDPDMATSFSNTFTEISTFHVMEIAYSDLYTASASRSLYVAIRGSSDAPFSRFSVIASTREFSRGRGEQYSAAALTAESQDYRRTQLLNIEPVSLELKTPYYDFFEYYFAKATNDVDVEIKVNSLLGCVNVYTSKIERFPAHGRAHAGYSGYWKREGDETDDSVCAVADGNTEEHKSATASFDGDFGGVYGSFTFRQGAAGEPTRVGISMKGMHDRGEVTGASWEIYTHAVGTQTDCTDPCGCADAPFFTDKTYETLPTTTDVNEIYTHAFDDADITLFGESVSGVEEGIDRSGLDQTVLGRSVVISFPTDGGTTSKVCATIFPDSSVTSYVGELRLMHTIKPEEDRKIFVSVQGASEYGLGDEQANNEYVIEAKIYRYRVDSNLLQPSKGAPATCDGAETADGTEWTEAACHATVGTCVVTVTPEGVETTTSVTSSTAATDCTGVFTSTAVFQAAEQECYTDANGVVSCHSDAEDRRYSVVTIDNFNYYEIDLSAATYGVTLHFTLAYGSVQLFTSDSKLPTQGQIGYTNKFGDPTAVSPCVGSVLCTTDDGNAALATGDKFEISETYHISIPFDAIGTKTAGNNYVFVGVLGMAPDSSYTISVTEYVFDGAMANLKDGEPGTQYSVPTNSYAFFMLYVGPEDEAMFTTMRSHAGARTHDLGTDPLTWGIDWTEPLTSTWIEQQQDEWDLDVDVKTSGLTASVSTEGLLVYGSTREQYPSSERGYDVQADCTVSGCADITVPHYTFSSKMVFISVFNGGETQDITITASIAEMYADGKQSDDTATVSVSCTDNCNDHGSCVDGKCYCDSTWLGDACEIEAFSNADGMPKLTIDASAFSASSTSAFPGDQPVTVPFALLAVPPMSKVHMYVDGLPYPAKGANIKHYTHTQGNSDFGDESLTIYGPKATAAGVLHTVELLLLSENNIPLATDMRDYTVDFHGGCQQGQDGICNGKGICHHGYCVCFDGFGGKACECEEGGTCKDGSAFEEYMTANFKPGEGYVQYNENLMSMAKQEDAYVTSLKTTTNTQMLQISDDRIKTAHDAVVFNLNKHIGDNAAKMDALKTAQADASDKLFRKRDRITTTLQQMREESRRLTTSNQEAYLETVRQLHEGQREMQNSLDTKRREHFVQMAKRHDEWVEIKEKNDFKLNQLRTANGPLVDIDNLVERECTQDDQFRTSCKDVSASDRFETVAGYKTQSTLGAVGTCDESDEARNGAEVGYRCVNGVKVQIDGEYITDYYDSIPR